MPQASEKHRMTRDQLQALSRKELSDMARKRGGADWHTMKKEELVDFLAPKKSAKIVRTKRNAKHAPVAVKAALKSSGKGHGANGAVSKSQRSAARDIASGSGGFSSPEEQVERSKFDIGVP